MSRSTLFLLTATAVALTGCQCGLMQTTPERCDAQAACPSLQCRDDSSNQWACWPTGEFYGHRPTCWRDWPTSGAQWRDAYCGPAASCYHPSPIEYQGEHYHPGGELMIPGVQEQMGEVYAEPQEPRTERPGVPFTAPNAPLPTPAVPLPQPEAQPTLPDSQPPAIERSSLWQSIPAPNGPPNPFRR